MKESVFEDLRVKPDFETNLREIQDKGSSGVEVITVQRQDIGSNFSLSSLRSIE